MCKTDSNLNSGTRLRLDRSEFHVFFFSILFVPLFSIFLSLLFFSNFFSCLFSLFLNQTRQDVDWIKQRCERPQLWSWQWTMGSTWWKWMDVVVDSRRDNNAAVVWLMWTELETLNELDTKTNNSTRRCNRQFNNAKNKKKIAKAQTGLDKGWIDLTFLWCFLWK